MTTCQRWRDRRGVYRPSGEPINTSDYEVAPISFTTAKAFVLRHHYSGSYPACRFRFGLFRGPTLVGVAVCSVPANNRALTNVFPGDPRSSVELGRFVLLDDVPANGESWFFARCRELLAKQEIRGVVAFSDDVPRRCRDGSVIFAGHIGTIYQASNATYLGRGTARTLRVLPDGTVLSDRCIQKIRKQEQGWQYSVSTLVRYGASRPSNEVSLVCWLQEWLPRLTEPLVHKGNHKYAWSLDKRKLFPTLTYPKKHFPTQGR